MYPDYAVGSGFFCAFTMLRPEQSTFTGDTSIANVLSKLGFGA